MIIVERKISELKLAEYNPRKLTKEQEKELRKSLESFDFVQPIIVNVNSARKNIVIGGNQRVVVAKRMKLKTLPCYEVNLSPEKERELNIRLNKNGGEWDFKKLKAEFDIKDLLGYGFEKKELDIDVPALVDKPAEKKKVRSNVEVQFQLGDLRFTLSQKDYVKWIDSIAHKVGLTKEAQVKEIKKRLGIK